MRNSGKRLERPPGGRCRPIVRKSPPAPLRLDEVIPIQSIPPLGLRFGSSPDS